MFVFILIVINWPNRHLQKQIDFWNKFDVNIKLNAQTGYAVNFLDLYIKNINGQLFTRVYHKPSYEPYYLPFNSAHPMHMKKNIPYEMLIRGIKYCSTFEAYLNEREKLRMSLLLNKHPGDFIDKQFDRAFKKLNIIRSLNEKNYDVLRKRIIHVPIQKEEVIPINFGTTMFVHFTYCTNMKSFLLKFHVLWNKYFAESPINEIRPVLGTRNVDNLQQRLVFNK